MAAEKLTKKRLLQILLVLIILLIAFFYRTFHYETNNLNILQKHLKKAPHFFRQK